MHLTSTEYYRDAIAWALLDEVDPQAIWQANLIAETGAEFNAAIEAAIRLQEITETYHV